MSVENLDPTANDNNSGGACALPSPPAGSAVPFDTVGYCSALEAQRGPQVIGELVWCRSSGWHARVDVMAMKAPPTLFNLRTGAEHVARKRLGELVKRLMGPHCRRGEKLGIPREKWPRAQGIYFVECADRVKIGISSCIAERLRGLSTAMPYPPRLLGYTTGGHRDERLLHESFRWSRTHGEWFENTPQLLRFIENVAVTR